MHAFSLASCLQCHVPTAARPRLQPIDMSFEPPCCVLSTIGLAQPGRIERGARAAACSNHLHQLHACLPSSPGKTKLLYR